MLVRQITGCINRQVVFNYLGGIIHCLIISVAHSQHVLKYLDYETAMICPWHPMAFIYIYTHTNTQPIISTRISHSICNKGQLQSIIYDGFEQDPHNIVDDIHHYIVSQ